MPNAAEVYACDESGESTKRQRDNRTLGRGHIPPETRWSISKER